MPRWPNKTAEEATVAYPKCKYDRGGTVAIVNDAKEEALFDPKVWADSPVSFGVITAPAEGQPSYDPALDVMKEDGVWSAMGGE